MYGLKLSSVSQMEKVKTQVELKFCKREETLYSKIEMFLW